MEKPTDFKGIAILILTISGIGGLSTLIYLATSEKNTVAIAILAALVSALLIVVGVAIAMLSIYMVAKKESAQFQANANENVKLLQEFQKAQNLQHKQLMADNRDVREEERATRRQIEPPTAEPDFFEFSEGIFEELDVD